METYTSELLLLYAFIILYCVGREVTKSKKKERERLRQWTSQFTVYSRSFHFKGESFTLSYLSNSKKLTRTYKTCEFRIDCSDWFWSGSKSESKLLTSFLKEKRSDFLQRVNAAVHSEGFYCSRNTVKWMKAFGVMWERERERESVPLESNM